MLSQSWGQMPVKNIVSVDPTLAVNNEEEVEKVHQVIKEVPRGNIVLVFSCSKRRKVQKRSCDPGLRKLAKRKKVH